MSYASVEQFIDYFGESEARELTHLDDPTAVSVDEVLLQSALNHATAEINSYVASQYTLPLASTPQVFVYHAMDIARYRLDKYRTREDVTDRYERVIQYLRDLARGIVQIGLDQNNQEVEGATGEPAYISAPPVFTPESLAGF